MKLCATVYGIWNKCVSPFYSGFHTKRKLCSAIRKSFAEDKNVLSETFFRCIFDECIEILHISFFALPPSRIQPKMLFEPVQGAHSFVRLHIHSAGLKK